MGDIEDGSRDTGIGIDGDRMHDAALVSDPRCERQVGQPRPEQ